MKKSFRLLPLLLVPVFVSGCSTGGEISLSIVYGIIAAISLLLLVGYCLLAQKKNIWFLLLFVSILIVNTGYMALSLSRSLETALLANRISYFGSVFLPMSMLMIILNVTRIQYQKWIPVLLTALGILVFLIAASPGYLDIYYKEVSFAMVNGVGILNKVYGPWHKIYLFYLLGYFAAMLGMIYCANRKHKLASNVHAVILVMAVLVNIFVWLMERFVNIEFKFLSISYIISEIFLLSLLFIMQENETLRQRAENGILQPENDTAALEVEAPPPQCTESEAAEPDPTVVFEDRHKQFLAGLPMLTQTERLIYEAYLQGKSTKAIMATLNITENTLKFHNKNIYGKLGVSSRKQMLEIYRQICILK